MTCIIMMKFEWQKNTKVHRYVQCIININWIAFQIKIFLTETGQETYLVFMVSSYLNKCNVLLHYTYSNSYH